MLGALEGERLSARGRKNGGNGYRSMPGGDVLVNAGEGDSAATAAMLAAILRTYARRRYGFKRSISRRQPGWQQRSQQL